MVLLRFVIPVFAPEALLYGVIGGIVGGLAIVIWWVAFSRAPWVGARRRLVLMIAAVVAVKPLLHKSIATGLMGRMFYVYAIPPFWARPLLPGRWHAGGCRMDSAARRWLRPSCSRVELDAVPNRRRHGRRRRPTDLAVDEDRRGAAARSGR